MDGVDGLAMKGLTKFFEFGAGVKVTLLGGPMEAGLVGECLDGVGGGVLKASPGSVVAELI
jgi:hypothetical protein